jgi:hypothetical protein
MSLKKLGVAFLALILLGAIAASEFNEIGGAWYTGVAPGTKLPAGRPKR